jgi:large subunit ribosomal protein L18
MHRTLFAVSNFGGKKTGKAPSAAAATVAAKAKKSDQAFALGEMIGKKAVEKGIAQAVFDRRSYRFHGRVKSFAEGAKKAGLKI